MDSLHDIQTQMVGTKSRLAVVRGTEAAITPTYRGRSPISVSGVFSA